MIKIVRFSKKIALPLVLLGLFLQPVLMIANAQAPEVIAVESRLSNNLASPLRKNFKDTSAYWLENYAQTKLNQTNEQAWQIEAQKQLLNIQLNGPREGIPVSPRLELLQELQAINTPEKKSILKGIDKTLTLTGKMALFNLLAQEQQPWDVIKRRQNFIRILVENPHFIAEIRAQLANIAANERIFIDGLSTSDTIIKEDQRITEQLLTRGDASSLLFALIFMAVNNACKKNDFLQLAKKHSLNISLIAGALSSFYGSVTAFINAAESPEFAVAGIMGLLLGSTMIYVLKRFNAHNGQYFHLAKGIAQACKSSQVLHHALSLSPITANLYGDLFPDASSEWFNFMGKTQTSTFNLDQEPSLFTHHGRVLNIFYRIPEVMNEIGTLLRFYGEIDAYTAIAQFIIDQKNTVNSYGEPVRVCFVEFIENAPSSILHTKNFWHPIIDKEIVRPSTLYLGEELPRDMIITGPNAGGKSVNLKALLTNLILAQTFGIACAEYWHFTPFTKIIARLKGVDDTASDKSKFMLEAIGMAALLKEMLELKSTEHAFVVTDELFTGTEVGPAISLSIELCSQIGKLPNVMYALATHYKQICELSRITDKTFENYRVSVFKDKENNKLIYPFTLSKGIGNTNVAFDIFLEQLHKEGITDIVLLNIINNAKLRQEAIEQALEHIDTTASRVTREVNAKTTTTVDENTSTANEIA